MTRGCVLHVAGARSPGRSVIPSARRPRSPVGLRVTVVLVVVIAGMTLILPSAPATTRSIKVDPGLSTVAARHPGSNISVIVREATPRTDDAERLVRSLHDHVTHELPIVGGFS